MRYEIVATYAVGTYAKPTMIDRLLGRNPKRSGYADPEQPWPTRVLEQFDTQEAALLRIDFQNWLPAIDPVSKQPKPLEEPHQTNKQQVLSLARANMPDDVHVVGYDITARPCPAPSQPTTTET